MKIMTNPPAPDRHTCIRIISRLRAGVAPFEGMRYLSVGMESSIDEIEQCIGRINEPRASMLFIQRAYGEGKSHTLHLLNEIAVERSCASVYLSHNHMNLNSFHRPSILFQHILQTIRSQYPEIDMRPFQWELERQYNYSHDRKMREDLPKKIMDLVRHVCKTRQGLVITLDEIENIFLLHIKSQLTAFYVLSRLVRQMQFAEGIVFVFAMTSFLAKAFAHEIGAPLLSAPEFTDILAYQLYTRLHTLHATAYQWTPSPDSMARSRQIFDQVTRETRESQWRAFVQRTVHTLDIEHQNQHSLQDEQSAVPQQNSVLPDLSGGITLDQSIPVPLLARPTPNRFSPGDKVYVLSGPLRDFIVQISELHDDTATVRIGQANRPIRIAVDQLQKVRS